MTKASDNVFSRFLISEGGSTSTPASGRVTMYAKADGLMYSKDDAGTEKLMSSGGAGTSVTSGEVLCSADTAITNAGWTDVSGVTQSLAAGTYNFWWKSLVTAAAQRSVFYQLLQGSTVIDEAESEVANGFRETCTGFSMNVVLGSTTTVKLQARADGNATVKRDGGQSTLHHPTKMGWEKIA